MYLCIVYKQYNKMLRCDTNFKYVGHRVFVLGSRDRFHDCGRTHGSCYGRAQVHVYAQMSKAGFSHHINLHQAQISVRCVSARSLRRGSVETTNTSTRVTVLLLALTIWCEKIKCILKCWLLVLLICLRSWFHHLSYRLDFLNQGYFGSAIAHLSWCFCR